jgi:hypothetical protein
VRSNSIVYYGGWLYIANSFLALVWRVRFDGQSPVEVWTADLLLKHQPNPPPGLSLPAHGLQLFKHEVYVSVSVREHIVALPINSHGSAGPGRVPAALEFDSRSACQRRETCRTGSSLISSS